MSDSPQISRRDWFRLRRPHQNQMLDEPRNPAARQVMQPIEQPPNHDGMNLADLPPMREAVLSDDQVLALFRDITMLASDILLIQRSTSARPDAAQRAESSQLEAARDALLSGNVQRVQVRYRWQESLWIDTLATQPNGFHLVRIAHRDR